MRAKVFELQDQLFEWQRTQKDVQTMLAKAERDIKDTTDKNWQNQLRLHGYHFVRGVNPAQPDDPNYGAWFPPGIDHIVWINETSTSRKLLESMVERAADRAAERALAKLIGRATEPGGVWP
jgi:hypothetical protein